MLNVLIIVVVVLAAGILLYPPLARAKRWRATITPLASIIGSGFLVIGPILHGAFGYLAPVVMAILCGGAYLFGAAIRYNIAAIDRGASARSAAERGLENMASWALAVAYFISVAYYLNLFGEFGLSLTDLNDQFHARLLATAVFLVILGVGWSYGFSALERMEQVTVGIKLAIIAGLLFGLGWYFVGKASGAGLAVETPEMSGWPAVMLVFGLLVTVQGFETSRYLGDEYDATTRIKSMKLAQWVSAVIYLVYISLLAFSFERGEIALDETAIIALMGVIAPILSVLLVAAALSAQFSAAVADAGGSGGLIAELTGQRLKPRDAYAVLVAVGLALTWSANVFEIISYASRAFAAYYGLQAAIAALTARRQGHMARAGLFAALAVLGVMITIFGVAVE
jgi:hypothetical protein